MFHLLGKSLPTVVGYFVSLLLTKILAGLPLISLRGGALSRKLLYRLLFSQTSLTQRELDEIHHPENVQYGWEYPMQLLVIVICFTYACELPAPGRFVPDSFLSSMHNVCQVFLRLFCRLERSFSLGH